MIEPVRQTYMIILQNWALSNAPLSSYTHILTYQQQKETPKTISITNSTMCQPESPLDGMSAQRKRSIVLLVLLTVQEPPRSGATFVPLT
jgi:hypothetical protein